MTTLNGRSITVGLKPAMRDHRKNIQKEIFNGRSFSVGLKPAENDRHEKSKNEEQRHRVASIDDDEERSVRMSESKSIQIRHPVNNDTKERIVSFHDDEERHEKKTESRSIQNRSSINSTTQQHQSQKSTSDSDIGDDIDTDLDNYIRLLLARRSFHLPHHNWCQDWMQYMRNIHPIFGLCLHHPLHPLKFEHRIFIFIGSIAFGLTATNSVYLYYAYSNRDMNTILLDISLGEVPVDIEHKDLQITHGMVALWTFGCILHSMFDITMWFMTACMCFLEGGPCGRFSRLRSMGSYFTIAIVAIMVAFASFVVTGRAIYESRLNAAKQGIILDDELWVHIVQLESFSFLLGYGVESLLVYFAYFPLLVTIAFSGFLQPCFRCMPFIRFLGGRQEEIERQYEERLEIQKKRNRKKEKRRNRSKDTDKGFEDDTIIIVD